MSLYEKREEKDDVQTHKAESPEPISMVNPPKLSDGAVTSDPEWV